MSLQTLLLATVIVGFGAAQYALMFHAMRDLVHRPRVRGGNKVLWGLVILCIPIGGALLYSWIGPTSFLHRPSRPLRLPDSLPRLATDRRSPSPTQKIIPIRRPGSLPKGRKAPLHGTRARSRPPDAPAPAPRRTGS